MLERKGKSVKRSRPSAVQEVLFKNRENDGGWVFFRMKDSLGSFGEIGRSGIGNIDELLRISVGEREPATLDLHHDAMATAERVIDIGKREI